MAVIGTVVAIIGAEAVGGTASVVTEAGKQHVLKLNDTVQPSDTIITPKGVVVELQLVNGKKVLISADQTVKITQELADVLPPSADDSAIDLVTVQTIITAIKEGKDINEVLEETAAGLNGGISATNYGFNFVNLLRITQGLAPLSFEQANAGNQQRDIEAFGDDNNNVVANAANAAAAANAAGTTGAGGTPSTGGGSSTTSENNPPIAVTDNYTMAEDGAAITLTPLTGDSDPDGTTPTIQSINGVSMPTLGTALTIPVTGGTVNVSTTGVITFTPAANFNGTVTFPYVITDGTTTATANQVITVNPVNDAPIAVTDNYTMAEDGAAITLTPLTGDSDPDGTTPTIQSINGVSMPALGTALTIPVTGGTVNVSTTGVITFTPAANFNGTVTFPYVITDGTTTATANQVITVNPVNDAPIAVTDNYTMAEDGAAITLTPLTGDSDPDGTTPTIQSINGVSMPALGTALTIPVTGGTVNVSTTGVITFTPAANFNGTVTFPYVITDGTTTATANQVITVNPVNDAPIAVTDNYTMAEDGAAITLTPLTGDSDPDGTTPTIQSINGVSMPALGTALTIPVTGGTVNVSTTGVITFTPAANFNGTVTFPYVITDGTTTATANQVITVNPVNDAPVDGDETNTVSQNVTLNVPAATGLLANTIDVDGDTPTVTSFTVNGTTVAVTTTTPGSSLIPGVGTITINSNGSYSFAPVANYVGPIPAISYTVSDGAGGADTSTLSLNMGANNPPVDGNETNTVTEDVTLNVPAATGLLANATDPDNNPLSITSFTVNGTTVAVTTTTPGSSLIPGVGTITINSNGSYSFAPAANYTGTIPVITYTISDGVGGTDTSTLSLSITPQPDAPIAVTDNYTMAEDGAAITLTPLTGDSDPDGTTPTIQSINGVSMPALGTALTIPVTGGTVNVSTTGVITFTPAANFNGTVTFPYVITDGTTTATANQVITVNPVNDAPIAVTDNYTMAEDGAAITLTPLTGDSDPDGTTPTIQSINGVSMPTLGTALTIPVTGGTVNVSTTGVITFTPAANFNGTVTFPYVITDGTTTATANQVITVNPVNDAPIAVTDNYTMAEDGAAITLTPLTGDSDPDGTTPTIQSINGVSMPALGTALTIPVTGGTVNVSTTGVITFTPAANFNGTVTFPYVITDGTTTATANQVITVNPVNDAPIAVTDNYTMAEDGAAITLTPLTGDSDPDGTTPTIQSINGVSMPALGTALTIPVTGGTVNVSTTGVITFTPAANFNGTVTFPYVITDGTTTATANQVITVNPVNDAPVDGDETNTVSQNVTLNVPAATGLLANTIDVDGDTPTVTSFTVNGTTVAVTTTTPGSSLIPGVGTITINSNGSYSFAPVANYVGPIPAISYTVSDGAGGADTSTLSLNMGANNPPVDGNETNTVTEDVTLNVPAATGLLANATDPDNNPLSITSFTVNGTTVAVTTTTPGSSLIPGVGTITINSNGSYSFAPAANYTGTIPVITYTISDGVGGTDTSTLSLSITPQPDAPIAVTDNYTMAEDGAAITLTPLTGDSDPDGTTPTIQSINGVSMPALGTALTIPVTGGTVNVSTTGVITFTPAANFNGTVTFPYVITDGTTTATANQVITVNPVNDAPIAVTDNYTMAEDGAAITLTPLTGDSDPDGTTPTIQSINGVSMPALGTALTIPVTGGTVNVSTTGVITFTPAANFNGTVTFPYVITDGTTTATANQVITVNPVNDAPIAVTDNYTMAEDGAAITLTPLTGDSDPDGTTPTIQSINGVSMPALGTALTIPVTGGTVNVSTTGVITFTPAANFNGTVTFPYVITDGTTTATANQVITVNPVNDAPIAVTDNYTMAEDGAAITLTPLTGDSDPDGTTPTIQSINGVSMPALGTALTIPVTGGTVNVSTTGVITFTPAANFNGTVTFPYVITDGTTTATANQVITVNPVNDAPIAVTDNYTMAEDGAAITLTPLTGDSDPDGTTPTIQSINGVSMPALGTALTIPVTGGTVNVSTTGVITFTPAANFNGTVTFPYVITDGTTTATANQVITVNPVNDAPIAVTDNYTMAEDGAAITLTPLTGDSDPDGTTPTIQSINGVSMPALGTALTIPVTGGTVNVSTTGVITFTPAANFNGTVTFPYVITDGTTTATANQVITVNPVNDAPIAVTDNYTMAEDGAAITLTPLTGDSDPDGTTPTIQSINGVSMPALGTALTIPVTGGTVNVSTTGVITFTPAANFNGTVTFPYVITDGTTTATANQVITVNPVNDAPIAVTDNYTMAEDGAAITLTPLTGDSDPDGTTPTIQSINGVSMPALGTALTIPVTGGTVNVSTTGVITFTPAANFNGTVTFPYVITDGTTTATANQVITVNPVNDAPVDGDETNTVSQNVTLNVPAATGLLANTIDVDGDTPTVTSFTVNGTTVAVTTTTPGSSLIPGVGTITINSNGSYSFAPVANYVGPIPAISYTVSDGAGGADTSTLSLNMGANNPPVDGNETNTVTEDVTLNVPAATGLLANATDPDNNPLSITSFTVNGTTVAVTTTTPGSSLIPGVGTITINSNGSYSFAPAANYTGTIPVITYTISDGVGGTDTSTLSLSITPQPDAPIAVTDNYTMAEDGAAITLTPLTGDSDPDGTTPTIQSINGVSMPALGTALTIPVTGGTVNVSTTGVITFTPAANFNGTVTFPYVITDGTTTATANQVITVNPVNDAPIAVTDNYTMAEDGAAITLTPLTGDSDPDGTTPTIQSINGVSMPALGTALTIPVTGGTVNVSTTGVITFTPAANFNGTVTFPYVITDGTTTATANQVITVNPVNDAPIAVTDNYTMAEDGAAITLTPLTGDSDPDGTTPTIQSINGVSMPALGTALTIPVTGGTVNVSTTGVITFTPAANFNGTVTFPYVITDGTTTATANQVITVNPVNDAPVDGDETNTVSQNVTLNVPAATGLLANTIDVDGDTPTVTSFTVNGTTVAVTTTTPGSSLIPGVGTITINSNGSYSFAPVANYVGPIPAISYTVSDGAGGADTSTLSLNMGANNPPVDGNETNTVTEDVTLNVPAATGLLANATDPDNNPLSITSFTVNGTTVAVTTTTPGSSLIPGVGTITINSNGSYSFAPAANYTGTIPVITYTISDGVGGTDTSTLSLSITPQPDAPIAVTDNYTMAEDGAAITLTPLTGDSDPDGTTPTIQSINGVSMPTLGTALTIPVTGGTVNVSTTGVITFTPAANFNGTVTFPYVITDGTTTATANQVITVNPVNDAPIAVTDNYTMAEDGAAITLTPLTGDSDPDGTTPTIQSINGVSMPALGTALTIPVTGGTVNVSTTGVITFTPAANFNGTVTFPYVITDGTTTATANQVITVNPVNDAPIAVTDNYTMAEDGAAITLTPLTGDSDPDGTTPTIQSINGVSMPALGTALTIPVTGGTVNVSTTGVITFTPAANFNGTVTFPYVITDGTTTATANQVITVNPVNDAPVDGDETNTVSQNVTLNVPAATGLLANTIDVDGDTPTVTSFTVNGTTVAVTTTTPGSSLIPGVGTITINSNGSYSFAPVANYVGPIPAISYTVSDGAGGADTSTLSLNMGANNPPVDGNETNTVTEDVTLNVPAATGLLANATDPDNNPLSITSFTVNGTTVAVTTTTPGSSLIPGVGTITINSNGSYSFAPAANYTGTIPVITYTISDGVGGTDTSTLSLSITPQPDAPIAVTDNYTMAEDGAAITLTPLTGDSDPDGTTPTIQSINGVSMPALGTALTIPVTGGTVNVSTTGVITFTPAANFNGTVTFPYVITDGTTTATANQVITVNPVNDAPVLDLDADNSTVSGAEYDALYFENGAPVSIADTDISITDVDDTNIESAMVVFLSPELGDVLTVGTLPSGISFTTSTDVSGNLVISLTGTATLAQYQTAIRAITFSSTSENPSTVERTITVTVNDGNVNSNTAISTITVLPQNDAPVLDLDANNSTATGTGYVTSFTENGAAVSIADTDVSVTDVDDTNIEGATITLTNFKAGDVLSAVGLLSGITASAYNATTGVITLTGTATLAQYQAAIRAITFTNTTDNPDTTARVVNVVVNDGNVNSNVAVTTINVTAVNDTPTITPIASIAVIEDVATKLTGLSFGDVDAATGNITVTLSVPTGTLAATSGSGVTVGGTATALTLTGTLSDINAFVSSGTGVSYTTALNANGTVNLSINVNDNGNTGTDPGLTGTATNEQANLVVILSITAVNDAPTATAGAQLVGTEDTQMTLVWASFGAADADTDSSGLSIRITTLPTDGVLTLNGVAVVANQLITKADIDSGLLKFTPDANESGIDAYTTAGVGNRSQDYANFNYQVFDGVSNSNTATVRIDITPVADAPVLSLGNAINIQADFNASTAVPTGWVTSNTGGTIEVNPASVYGITGLSSNVIELERDAGDASNFYTEIQTVAGQVYTLTFDYSPRSGFLGASSQINVRWSDASVTTQTGTIVFTTSLTDANTVGWKRYTITLVGTGSLMRLEFDALDGNASTSFGGLLDNIALVSSENVGAVNTAITLTSISASLTDTDGSESISNVTISNINVGATITDGTNTFTASTGNTSANVTSWNLSSLKYTSSTAGTDTLTVSATSTEATTGSTSTTTGTMDVIVQAQETDTSGNDLLVGTGVNDNILAANGADQIYGVAGNDILNGGAGNDLIVGGLGSDNIRGGTGNDTMIGGNSGSDDLTTDTFVWQLSDAGTTSAVAIDTIQNFGTAAASSGGDVLNLKDLLTGESNNAASLDNYLHFNWDGTNTTLYVSATGAFSNNNNVGNPANNVSTNDVQQIVFAGVNLVGSSTTDQQVITNLINQQKLITD